MPADMKELIAEECQITKQTFYYHFEDIPSLVQWILDRSTEKMLKEIQLQENMEEQLRYFFNHPQCRPLYQKRQSLPPVYTKTV
ncbi:MAG TPA: hypothetical protein IAB48_12740 [Candidatus Fimimorpha excrementavium]|nr:hypothetical protein [Candidatus Fimimorpha excrementavium]